MLIIYIEKPLKRNGDQFIVSRNSSAGTFYPRLILGMSMLELENMYNVNTITKEHHSQCDQMASVLVQYLAICKTELLPKIT